MVLFSAHLVISSMGRFPLTFSLEINFLICPTLRTIPSRAHFAGISL